MTIYASPRGARGSRSAGAYANIGLETKVLSATPEQLITLLFDGVLAAITKAGLYLENGDIQGRGTAISKAIDIIDSGLKASLDMEAGGELSRNLAATYEIILHHLLQANLHADAQKLELAKKLLADIADAWRTATSKESAPA